LSLPVKKQEYCENYPYEVYYGYNCGKNVRAHVKKKSKRKKKNGFLAFVFAILFLSAYGYYIVPYIFEHYTRPLFVNRYLNRNITFNYDNLFPTLNYLHNSYFMDTFLRVDYLEKSKEIAPIKIISEMTATKNKLLELFKKYPQLEPAVFVWDYESGGGFEINSDKPYPSASIIKIPIAYEFMRLLDRTSNSENPVKLFDKREFSEIFKTSGSGKLQYMATGTNYSLNHLAKIMITDSDNSATNMILYEIGGMDAFNRSMRNYGLKTVSMGEWLPDLEGKNKISAREISEILYNLDNPNYINPRYKTVLQDYLSNVKNTHLIKEKLPPDAIVLHKTGNIGKMLGDAAIISTKSGSVRSPFTYER